MDGNTMKRLYVLLTTFLVSLFCVHSLCFAEYHDIKEIGIKINLPLNYRSAGEADGGYLFGSDEVALLVYYEKADKFLPNQELADAYAKISDNQYMEALDSKKGRGFFVDGLINGLKDGPLEADILASQVVTLENGNYLRCDLTLKAAWGQLPGGRIPARIYHTKKGRMVLLVWFYFLDSAKPVTYTDKLISSINFYWVDAASPQPPKAEQGGREEKTDKQAAQATAKPASVERAQPAAKGDTTNGGSAVKSKKTASGLEGMLMKGLAGGIAALIIRLLMLAWARLKDRANK